MAARLDPDIRVCRLCKQTGHRERWPVDFSGFMIALFDDFDHPAGARLNQNCAPVYYGVSIIVNAIFRGHVVVGDALLGQNRAHPHVLAIAIVGTVLFDDIVAKARPLIDAKYPGDAADYTANDPSDHGAHGTGGALAFSRAMLDSAGDALGLGDRRERDGGDEGSN